MEISTPTHPRTSQKHGKGQAEGCGQVSHMRIMAGYVGIEATAISGHSTRIGKAQDCVVAGISIGAIMRDGGWKSEAMVARYTEHLQMKQGASAILAARQARL